MQRMASTGMPHEYMDKDYPVGLNSMNLRLNETESSPLETDVYIWYYTLSGARQK